MYRLDTLEILKEKKALDNNQLNVLNEKSPEMFDGFYKGVSLFQRISSKQDTIDLYFLAESLKSRKDFQIVALADSAHYSMIDDTIYSNSINRVVSDQYALDSFFGDNRFLLAKDSFLRKEYGYGHEEFLLAYEHSVVLLPMKKKDKVKLVRNKSTN